jgi:hypothetical protein
MTDDEQTEVEREPAGEFDTDQRPYTHGAYFEDENYVPDPYAQYGTVHTSGTAGDDVHGSVHEVSPVFQIARTNAMVQAARALDPDDPTPSDTVILPGANYRTEEDARETVLAAARQHLEHPVELGMTDARRRAGLTGEEMAAEDARHGGHHHRHEAPVAPVDEKTAENTGWVDQNQNA